MEHALNRCIFLPVTDIYIVEVRPKIIDIDLESRFLDDSKNVDGYFSNMNSNDLN